MNELCILQDDVPSFPNQVPECSFHSEYISCYFSLSNPSLGCWQVAFDIIEEELGQPLEAVFSKISSQTIAAASLGQVYRATLRSTGEDVAIKVSSATH